jgi:hypothetical protein
MSQKGLDFAMNSAWALKTISSDDGYFSPSQKTQFFNEKVL